jgi:hypothetical protein
LFNIIYKQFNQFLLCTNQRPAGDPPEVPVEKTTP